MFADCLVAVWLRKWRLWRTLRDQCPCCGRPGDHFVGL